MLPNVSAYRRRFDKTKYIILITNYELLKKHKDIWGKVSNTIKKAFVPGYNYVRTKINSYEGKIITNFHEDKIQKEGSQSIWLSVISFTVFLEQVKIIILKFLEECIRVVKENNMPKYVTHDVKSSTDDENSDKENQIEE